MLTIIEDNDLTADWIKTLSWDLPTDSHKFLAVIGGMDKLDHFMTLPAATKMPDSLKVQLFGIMHKHLMGQHDQSTHGRGRKAPTSVADLVADADGIQKTIDEITAASGGSPFVNGNVAMRVLLDRLGKGGKPEIVKKLDGAPMYRGTSAEGSISEVKGEYARVGVGVFGDGYYFSNDKKTAEFYARDANQWSPSKKSAVYTAGWKKDAKVFVVKNADDEYSAWDEMSMMMSNASAVGYDMQFNWGGESEQKSKILKNFYDSGPHALSTDLLLQGYDGIQIDTPNKNEAFTVVFNRGALQVVGE